MELERNSVVRRSKQKKTYGGLLIRWEKKYLTPWVSRGRGYNLNNASYVVSRRYSRGKMSPVCHNFVQNAWKKDLCSNCFKSREDHQKVEAKTEGGKYLATPFQNRGTFFKKSPSGILKLQSTGKAKRNVSFPEEVSSVIGYGGDDWPSDEEFEVSEDNDEDDTFPDTEEERELYKITKSNTDYNTVKANLLGGNVTKPYTPLMLGKEQTDSDGKKKTLLVSVTPFGQDSVKTTNVKSHIRKPAAISVIKSASEDVVDNFTTNIIVATVVKESETLLTTTEPTANSICSEKSLLDEITETLEQNRISANNALSLANERKPSVVDEKIKEGNDLKEHNDLKEENEKRENELKKNSLTRNCPITKNTERPKVTLGSRSEFKFCKINSDSCSVDSAVSGLNSVVNTSLNSDDESISGRLDSDNDDSGHFSETNKTDETVKITVFKESNSGKIPSLGHFRTTDAKKSGYSTFQAPVIDMPTIIPKQPNSSIFSVDASRELAGEPDGRADPDPDEISEPPALPKSPVPVMDPRPSFLHGMISDITPSSKPAVPEKPKITLKPLKPPSAKKTAPSGNKKEDTSKGGFNEEKNNEITEVREEKPEAIYYAKPVLTKQDSDSSLCSMTKRKAPTPPSSPSVDDHSNNNLYQRNPHLFMKSDSPVVRELEKRERAHFIPKPKQNDEKDTSEVKKSPPEPAPRRNISLSHDNLLIEDKRKGKMKFSIRKLLRIGSSKDLDKKELSVATVTKIASKPEEIYDITPKPKPRLVIIHPLDINGTNVEVVKANDITESLKRISHDDSSSIYSGSSSATDPETPIKVVTKPPPPPRHISDDRSSATTPPKPIRPPPPKSAALQKKLKQQTWSPSAAAAKHDTGIYANLGEIRSALTPRKPERTASMREREAQLELPKRRVPIDDDKDDLDDIPQDEIVQATNDAVINNYDDVYNSTKYDNESIEDNVDSAKSSDSDYEYVNHARSSSPECDSAIKPRGNIITPNREIIKMETSPDYPKYSNGIFNRSSLPYCGSETESEIYSPYSFYSSTDAMDSPGCEDYQNDVSSKTTSKLRVRKGRSIVHKNLEDNYGAVVIANHEALAQVLEQVQQSATMAPSLRGLKASTNLRWSDFCIATKSSLVKAGKRIFYPAVWSSTQGPVNVTLMLCKEQMASQIVCQQSIQPPTLSLNAITEFCDLIPLQQFGEDGDDLVQATIVVLAPAQVDTIQSYGEALHATETESTKEYQLFQTEQTHEAIFLMLQIINGLKCLQARGVEEAAESLSCFVSLKEVQQMNVHGSSIALPTEDRLNSLSAPKTNSYGRLCILQGLSEEINSGKVSDGENLHSLCRCAMRALEILLPGEKLTPLLKEVLQEERAISLNQAKSVLEFSLWGPLDVVQGVPVDERELSLQRWLDLERATVLHGLVRSRVQLNVFEQLHLMFLVRSTAKTMCDASVLLEKAKVY